MLVEIYFNRTLVFATTIIKNSMTSNNWNYSGKSLQRWWTFAARLSNGLTDDATAAKKKLNTRWKPATLGKSTMRSGRRRNSSMRLLSSKADDIALLYRLRNRSMALSSARAGRAREGWRQRRRRRCRCPRKDSKERWSWRGGAEVASPLLPAGSASVRFFIAVTWTFGQAGRHCCLSTNSPTFHPLPLHPPQHSHFARGVPQVPGGGIAGRLQLQGDAQVPVPEPHPAPPHPWHYGPAVWQRGTTRKGHFRKLQWPCAQVFKWFFS